MNKIGEIKKLVEIAKPQISIITNIGNAHIGNFNDSLEIAKEKSDIFEFFTKKSIAIIPGDSNYLNIIKKKHKEKLIIFLHLEKPIIVIQNLKLTNMTKYLLLHQNIKLILKKKSNFNNWEINISIILTVLETLDLDLKKFSKNLENLKPLSGRGEIKKVKKN